MAGLPQSERDAIRAFLIEKESHRQLSLDERYRIAVENAGAIIQMIMRDYNPRRIYQWGSLLDRAKFQEISDIDIAVEGLRDAEELFKLYGDAEKMTDLPLDIVELERIHQVHASGIRERGRLIYERSE
jgi:predicted nucleotidyltransferase